MLIALKQKKVVEKFVKNLFMTKNTHLLNGHMLLVHIGIASIMQFQCVPKTYMYVTEIKESYFEIHICQESCLLALPPFLKHLNLPISIKIPVTIIMTNCLY